jgi:hypothetical protein
MTGRGNRISLGDHHVADLLDGEDPDLEPGIIIPFDQITIVLDYPLTDEVRYEHKHAGGFTNADLLRLIAHDYDRTYAEEYQTRHIVYRLDSDPDALNSGSIYGRYGIWGYDLDELRVLGVYVNGNEVTLDIDTI